MPTISPEKKSIALKVINKLALETTLNSCKDSAPGPDGISYSILKTVWPSFGTVLINAWHHSTEISILPPSHNQSTLKLIPKAGKNLKEIKNWRPITLSNCDHKLITKTLSKQLADALEDTIEQNQTAYMKTRSISDNIRVTLHYINLEEPYIK